MTTENTNAVENTQRSDSRPQRTNRSNGDLVNLELYQEAGVHLGHQKAR